ncbi:MAG: DNA polymerase III subunit gamma/tau, partial [Paraburkholderia sp.]|nr:DNA polymerase III subunit gamma/tau [Paraburkholderia sp.]
AGFTMTLLRMLAFEPSVGAGSVGSAPASKPAAASAGAGAAAPAVASARNAAPAGQPVVQRDEAAVPPRTASLVNESSAAQLELVKATVAAKTANVTVSPATEATVTKAVAESKVVPPWEDEAETVPEVRTEQAEPATDVAPAAEPQAVQAELAAPAPQPASLDDAAASMSVRGGASAALDVLRNKGMRVPPSRAAGAAVSAATPASAPKAAPRVEVKVPTPDPARRSAAAQQAQARQPASNANAQQDASGAPPWDDIPPDDYVPLSAGDAYYAPPDDGFVPAYDGEPSASRASASAPVSSPAVVDVSKLPPGIPLEPIGFTGDWPALAATLSLKGISYQLAFNSELTALEGTLLKLSVPVPQYAEASQVAKLKSALAERLGKPVDVSVEVGPARRTAAALDAAARAQRQREAEREIGADPFVQQLIRDFGASIVPGSIRPVAPAAASGGSQAAH